MISSKKYHDLEFKFSLCQMKLSSTLSVLEDAKKRLQECGFKIYNQQKEIARLHKTIKELKNEKNS